MSYCCYQDEKRKTERKGSVKPDKTLQFCCWTQDFLMLIYAFKIFEKGAYV